MKRIPLQLEHAFPTKIHFEARPDGDPSVRYDVRSRISTSVAADNDRKWMVALALEITPSGKKKPTYSIAVEYVGFFVVEKVVPTEKVESLVTVNGPTMLYSAARELISLLSARGPWPEVTLMTVTFIDTVRECSGRKPESSSKAVEETVGIGKK